MYFNPNNTAEEEDEKHKQEDLQNKRFFKFCLLVLFCFFVTYIFFFLHRNTCLSRLHPQLFPLFDVAFLASPLRYMPFSFSLQFPRRENGGDPELFGPTPRPDQTDYLPCLSCR